MSLSLLPGTCSASQCDFKLTTHLSLAASASAVSTWVFYLLSLWNSDFYYCMPALFLSTHLLVFVIYQMTHHISASDISLRSSRAACCFRNHTSNTQTHTHFNSACSQFDKKCVHGTHTGAHVTRRGVYVLDNTAEPTTKKKTRAHANKHTLTHNLAICPVHSAVASGDNTLHWTKTHRSLHTRTSSRLCELGCTFACWHLSWNPQWKLWEQSRKLITRHQHTRAAHEIPAHTCASIEECHRRTNHANCSVPAKTTLPLRLHARILFFIKNGKFPNVGTCLSPHLIKAREPTMVKAATKATAGRPRVKTLHSLFTCCWL